MLASLGGCVSHGDLGRYEPSFAQQRLGFDRYAHVTGYAGSHDYALPLTPDEQDLRAHAYSLRFTYAHQPTHGHWSEYDSVIPDKMPMDRFPDAARYVRQMVRGSYRSPDAMINAIVDDIRSDLIHIDAFQSAATAVYAADATRVVELERFGAAEEATARTLSKRIADNRYIVEHVQVALTERIEGYERALSDVLLAGGQQTRTAAYLELEGIKRRTARLESQLRHTDGRYALNLPREPRCLEPSIARPC